MSAGLLASTSTPSTANPDASVTEPAIAAWASADTGTPAIQTNIVSVLTRKRVMRRAFQLTTPRRSEDHLKQKKTKGLWMPLEGRGNGFVSRNDACLAYFTRRCFFISFTAASTSCLMNTGASFGLVVVLTPAHSSLSSGTL